MRRSWIRWVTLVCFCALWAALAHTRAEVEEARALGREVRDQLDAIQEDIEFLKRRPITHVWPEPEEGERDGARDHVDKSDER